MRTPACPGSSLFERLRFIGDIEGLTTPQRIVLYELFVHANRDGYAWPSRKRLAGRCGFGDPASPRAATVTKAMIALEDVIVAGEPLIVRCAQRGKANRVRLHSWLRAAAVGDANDGDEYASRTEQSASSVLDANTPSVPPSKDRPEREEERSIVRRQDERTPSGVRTSSRSPSPTATSVVAPLRDYDWSIDYQSPFRHGEAFELGKALDAAADFLDDDSDVFAPRERVIEVMKSFMDETRAPYSWSWFAKPSAEGVCRIDRAKGYLQSGNLMEIG